MKKLKITAIALISFMTIAMLTGCASWDRFKKSQESEWGNGLNREVIVFSATGEEIWRFEGKCDIDYSSERILFDDENNKRHTIYFKGGTVIVNEI